MNARAVFYSAEDARAVVDRLVGAGFAATLARERFAGEDDDEDHPWAVVSEAPEFMLDLLVEEYDGWLDVEGTVDETAVDPAAPPDVRPLPDRPPPDLPLPDLPLPDLPRAPRRIKNHFPRD